MKKILILGATGLLGQHATQYGLTKGYKITMVGRSQPDEMLIGLQKQVVTPFDILTSSQKDLIELLRSHSIVIMAFGADDREIHPAPAQKFFQENLVDLTERVVLACVQASVKQIIICGSYFTAWDREHPELGFKDHHIYVQARVKQQEVAFKYAQQIDVKFLEIPYVFGTIPTQTPMWKDWLFERIRKMPIVFYPKGGSAIITASQVGEALINLCDVQSNEKCFVIVDENWTWKELIKIILKEMNKLPIIINAPYFISQRVALKMKANLKKEGKESGIDPKYLMKDIMTKELFFDPIKSHQILKFKKGGIKEEIIKTLKKSSDL